MEKTFRFKKTENQLEEGRPRINKPSFFSSYVIVAKLCRSKLSKLFVDEMEIKFLTLERRHFRWSGPGKVGTEVRNQVRKIEQTSSRDLTRRIQVVRVESSENELMFRLYFGSLKTIFFKLNYKSFTTEESMSLIKANYIALLQKNLSFNSVA